MRPERGLFFPLASAPPFFHFIQGVNIRGTKHRLLALICSVRSLSSTECNLCKRDVDTVIRVALSLLSTPNVGSNRIPVFFLSAL